MFLPDKEIQWLVATVWCWRCHLTRAEKCQKTFEALRSICLWDLAIVWSKICSDPLVFQFRSPQSMETHGKSRKTHWIRLINHYQRASMSKILWVLDVHPAKYLAKSRKSSRMVCTGYKFAPWGWRSCSNVSIGRKTKTVASADRADFTRAKRWKLLERSRDLQKCAIFWSTWIVCTHRMRSCKYWRGLAISGEYQYQQEHKLNIIKFSLFFWPRSNLSDLAIYFDCLSHWLIPVTWSQELG